MSKQTKNKAIEELYLNPRFNDCINKMNPEHLRADLKSEVIMILFNTDEKKILSLHRNGQLLFYAIRIVLNTIRSSSSPFNKKFRKQYDSIFTDEAESNPGADELIYRPEEEEAFLDRQIKEMEQDKMYGLLKQIRLIADQQYPDFIAELEARPYPNIGWYKQYLLSLYMKCGTFRAIERETRIPFESCHKTITLAIKQLREYATTKQL